MTYTQVWDAIQGQVSDNMIQRDEDSAFIPFDPANIDYQAYLAWLDEGNQPTPVQQPAQTRPTFTRPASPPKVKPHDRR